MDLYVHSPICLHGVVFYLFITTTSAATIITSTSTTVITITTNKTREIFLVLN
jgi:hypothetical protein